MGLWLVILLLSSSGCLVTFENWPDQGATSTGSQSSKGGAPTTTVGGAGTNPLVSGGAANAGTAGTNPLVSGGAANAGTAGTNPLVSGGAANAGTAGTNPLVSGGAANAGTAGTNPLVSGGAANAGTAGSTVATGGSAGSTVATGGSAGSTVATGGSTAGGAATGGSTTGGVANGGAATGGATFVASNGQVLWLSLNGDRASLGEQPNSLLNIDGRFYATKDSCSTVAFDTATRCVEGTLCSYAGVNWGMAVQFDFRTMGPPTNGKLLWNPEEHDALGVAWSISGNATTALQLWVLDMATNSGTSCTSDPCEILGPPWGRAGIGLTGGVYFDSMDRDDWNGTGIDYAYDPTRVFALQFKIPAVQVPGASFRFCIDQLGIIVPR